MSRNRLSVTKLDDFIAFCEADGWVLEKPKGDFEVARLRRHGKLAVIWRRSSNSSGTPLQNLTLDRVGEVLFDIWIKERSRV